MRPFLRRLAARPCKPIPAVLLLLASMPASALTTLCVGTGAELRQALGTANLTADAVDIRLRTGTPLAGGTRFEAGVRSGFSTQISGGWNTHCSVQTRDSALTVADAEPSSPLRLVTDDVEPESGSLGISNLTLTRGQGCLNIGLR